MPDGLFDNYWKGPGIILLDLLLTVWAERYSDCTTSTYRFWDRFRGVKGHNL
jgi:hypothetical protein